MPCIDAQDACRDDKLIALSRKYPNIKAEEHGNFVRLTPEGASQSSLSIWCDYRELDESRVQRDADRFRYTFSHTTRAQEYIGPFSHPNEEGCWIMARRYFIDAGMIVVPTDNSHLTAKTTEYVDRAQRARTAETILPVVGDIILDRNGLKRRLSIVREDQKVQATKALEHSYYLHIDGTSSFSGTCGHVLPQTETHRLDAHERARFWVFKDNRAGGGRGVDVFVDVAVWQWSGSFEGTP